MNAPVERLQALLARVQENRHQPRDGAADAHPQIAAVPQPVYQPAQPAPASRAAATQPRTAEPRGGRPAATPLEMAVEGRLGEPAYVAQPAAPNPAPVRPQLQQVQPQAQPQAQPRAQAAAPAAPVSHEGVVLVEANVAQPTRPIAQVVSMNPPSLAPTFGELLRRSLSLRPR